MKLLDNTTDSTEMNLSKLQEITEDGGAWCATVHGVTESIHDLETRTTTFLVCRNVVQFPSVIMECNCH